MRQRPTDEPDETAAGLKRVLAEFDGLVVASDLADPNPAASAADRGRPPARRRAAGEHTAAQSPARSRPSEGDGGGSEDDPAGRARGICLRLLTGSAKTRKQLAEALAKREFPEDVAAEVLDRLEEVGLIDDAAFAESWVEIRQRDRGLSRRALARELRTRGVAREVVEEAVAQVEPEAEEAAARALVGRKLPATRGLDRDVRTRRLVGLLARRGYGEGVAFRVVREALESERSDADGAEGADGADGTDGF